MFFGLFGLTLAAGIFGSYAVARKLDSPIVWFALLAWFFLPFMLIAAVLLGQMDLDMATERGRGSFKLNFIFYAFTVGVAWLPALIGGTIFGRLARRKHMREQADGK